MDNNVSMDPDPGLEGQNCPLKREKNYEELDVLFGMLEACPGA
jgi:hypothetical protein